MVVLAFYMLTVDTNILYGGNSPSLLIAIKSSLTEGISSSLGVRRTGKELAPGKELAILTALRKLLILAGDVETNPGPGNGMQC